ncbi:MAG: OmpA family protein [Prevotellaceae bacterium]|jgi:peptidoglycan-associated lipoprotein|nr:OmpA family protein [Prevotellaceae bacterium]
MKFNKTVILLSLLTLALSTSCSLSQQIKKADRKYDMGEYFAAAPLYKRIMPRIPAKNKAKRLEIAVKMANCYRLTNQNVRAEAAYNTAVRQKTRDWEFYLPYAEVLRKNEKYKEARSAYLRYLRHDSANVQALNGIISCDSVRSWLKLPSEYSVKKAAEFNSRRGDFSPVVGDDTNEILYFTSSRPNAETGKKNSAITGIRNNDIFVARRNASGKWEPATPLPAQINTEFDEGACCFSNDGKVMYFTRCRYEAGETLGAEIYSSQRSGGEWMEAKKLFLVKDSTISTAHPAMSPDDKYLYFSSDREGGFGGKDIWRSERISDAEWGVPENLGEKINTPGDEMFPSFAADGTLYFSSDGLPGFGGLDIFKAQRVEQKDQKDDWIVKNMMSPINSGGDDFGISFVRRKQTGYFSSNRKEPKGWDKIYMFAEPVVEFEIRGKVLDNNDEIIQDAVVRIVGDNGSNVKMKVKKDGSYSYKLERGINYVMQASARGYLNEKNEFSTIGLTKTRAFDQNFILPSVGKPQKIDNIFYDFGKYTLNPRSEEALQKLVKMLTDNPHITIEIGAHTDMVGSDEYNDDLSLKRAQSVVNFLIKAGIEKERLTAKGYGKTVPVTVDEELASSYSFLKEGDVLNEEFISRLSEKNREIANQINRRTEMRVLKMTYKMY